MRPPASVSIEGWQTTYNIELPRREKNLFDFSDLKLTKATNSYLSSAAENGIYLHQKEAIRTCKNGANVCVTTGTASGKSLIFYAAALEKLCASRKQRILAIYPTKALAAEQEQRWTKALRDSGLQVEIGRIEGGVPLHTRPAIVRRSSILIMTPDVIHAWLLSNLTEKSVVDFLRQLELIIVDEIHNYTGVFGSNSGFLFRRLQHLMQLLGTSAQYICASATIAEPQKHLSNLFGQEFVLIDSRADTSPRFPVSVKLMTPTSDEDLLSSVTRLMTYLTQKTECRFLAFVDSRKQAEQISAILSREQEKDEEEERNLFRLEHLEKLDVLPFRSGYEEEDRRIIQDRLNRRSLRGIVSTSALELGMDIPSLDIAILVGVPRSSTSLMQRIGRIGRSEEGAVFVLNTKSVYDEAVFAQPENLLNRPLAEGALYLENPRIQYIHALCLARNGGEHDQIVSVLRMKEDYEFASSVKWPEGFVELCRRERRGEVSTELQGMKAESEDDPNHVFPLRDVESSFKVEFKRGPDQRQLGTLSYAQVMREAYPGAIYYYLAKPYRIFKVNVHSRVVQARNERGYTTKPQALPTLVFPNLTLGNVFRGSKCADLIAMECNLQIREWICGIKERRGPNELLFHYPLAVEGIFYTQPRFARNYFTTGVVITHPVLGAEKVDIDLLANLFFEAFLMIAPYERRDIAVAVDRHRADRGPISAGQRFIALYDQTYGSLRLSGRVLEDHMLRSVVETAKTLLQTQEFHNISSETVKALDELSGSCQDEMSSFLFDSPISLDMSSESYVQVIMPGSRGLNVRRSNEEFEVEAVFYSPQVGGLAYRGRYPSTTGETTKDIVPLDFISEIPGESKTGQYNLNSGEIEDFKML